MSKQNVKTAARNNPPDRVTPTRARKEREAEYIIKHYLQGLSYPDICKKYEAENGQSFGRGYCSNVVRKATEQWIFSKNDLIEQHKAVELQKINNLEFTYWEAWETSKRIQKAKTETKTKPKDGKKLSVSEVQATEKESAGDPRFLQGIQWCVEKRCVLLGFDVPAVAIQVNNNNSGEKSTSTTIVRRVVFQTRETSGIPQVIKDDIEQ